MTVTAVTVVYFWVTTPGESGNHLMQWLVGGTQQMARYPNLSGHK